MQLTLEPLTKEAFAPFGDVIETTGTDHFAFNNGGMERYHDLGTIMTDKEASISMAISKSATQLPFHITEVERHPLGSQAFIPMGNARIVTVVAKATDTFDPSGLKAFITNGQQGFNYHTGTWHMPLITPEVDLRFVVIDRKGAGDNCDVLDIRHLDIWLGN